MAQIQISAIKNELRDIIKAELDTVHPLEGVQVYRTPQLNIPVFPAVNLETADFMQTRHALGGIKKVRLRINVFIWTKIYNPEESEDLLVELMQTVLGVLEKTENRKRTGLWQDLVTEVTEERIEFGVVDDPENFLQGVKIPIYLEIHLPTN